MNTHYLHRLKMSLKKWPGIYFPHAGMAITNRNQNLFPFIAGKKDDNHKSIKYPVSSFHRHRKVKLHIEQGILLLILPRVFVGFVYGFPG